MNETEFSQLCDYGALLADGARGGSARGQWSEEAGVIDLLRSHRLLGGLHLGPQAGSVSVAVREAAAKTHREVLRANLGVVAQLGWLFEILRREGIEFALLKGPVLAEAAWGHLGARVFGDIDLLVHEETLDRAAAALTAEGFEEGEMPQTYERVFLHHARSFKVELHGRLVSREFLPRWEERVVWPAVEVELPGIGQVPTLREDWHFLFGGIHAAKHLLEFFFPPAPIVRLGLYVEIARWAQRRELDWSGIVAKCDRLGCRRAVLHGPACAQAWFGWTPPPALAKAMDETAGLARLVELVTAGVGVGHAELKRSPRQLWRQIRVVMALRDSRGEGAKFAAQYFLPPLVRRWRALTGRSQR